MENRTPIINVMQKAAEKASYAIIRDFGELEKLQVSKKGFKNFVTSADRKAEDQIKYVLSKAYPDFSFISEESGKEIREDKEKFWIIDPIDGTTNFMRGIPCFAINISFLEGKDITAGITYNPLRGECFKADMGSGAFLANKTRLRVSGREDLTESLIAVHMPHDEEKKIIDLGAITRRTGSIALDLAYFSAGKFDAVIAKNVRLWDISTGLILTKESGGFQKCVKNEMGTFDIISASSSKMLKKLVSLYDF